MYRKNRKKTFEEPIVVEKAETHNLKQISLHIPRKQFVVVTGLSGSGKSSLAFDTLFAEGQKRYIESLNPYLRQFLGKQPPPKAKSIRGLPPTIGLPQKGRSHHPRARVSTTADIFPYLRILFARIGTTYSPVSGQPVTKHDTKAVVHYILSEQLLGEVLILAPLYRATDRSVSDTLETEQHKGYTRLFYNGTHHFIEALLQNPPADLDGYYLLVDRLFLSADQKPSLSRLADSVEKAFFEGEGHCFIHHAEAPYKEFSNLFQLDGIAFEEPSLNFFSFNSAQGACKLCKGLGKRIAIDPEKVIPDGHLSILQGAIAPWRSLTSVEAKAWFDQLVQAAPAVNIPLNTPYNRFSKKQIRDLWEGTDAFEGLNDFFSKLAKKTYKIQYRLLLARYRGKTRCQACQGTGIRPDANYVKIGGKSIVDLLLTSIEELSLFFDQLTLTPEETLIAQTPLEEITTRLRYLNQVGVGYLTLDRSTDSLSGGEYQRIKLTRSLGSSLVDALYVLDEPTIGLDSYNTKRLIEVLKELQAIGNTVLVVEHEDDLIRSADQVIEIGPKSGSEGGEVVFQGTPDALEKAGHTYTGAYLSGKKRVPPSNQQRVSAHALYLRGMRQHNLKNIDLKIPLGVLCVLTGRSGSGKSTVVDDILYPALSQHLNLRTGLLEANFDGLEGDLDQVTDIAYFNQQVLGRSARSNPATFLQAYDPIRQLFAETARAQAEGYTAGHFSFNVEGGRCPHCQGMGTIQVDMQFMADIQLPCEECHGKRFQEEILSVTYQGKNISEILDMRLTDGLVFFEKTPAIIDRIAPAVSVGLGYLTFGQSCSTLSGGEAQRLKLSTYLQQSSKYPKSKLLFIFDEPSRGLHMHDIHYLMQALHGLVDKGHSVLIIEHHLDIIQAADWVIELGKEGGKAGGEVTFSGSVAAFAQTGSSFLAQKMAQKIAASSKPSPLL